MIFWLILGAYVLGWLLSIRGSLHRRMLTEVCRNCDRPSQAHLRDGGDVVIELHPHTAFTEESRPSWTDGGDPALWTPTPLFELQPVSAEDLKSGARATLRDEDS